MAGGIPALWRRQAHPVKPNARHSYRRPRYECHSHRPRDRLYTGPDWTRWDAGMPSYIEQMAEDEADNPEGRLARFRIDLPPKMVLAIDAEAPMLDRSSVVKGLIVDGFKYRELNRRMLADRLQRRGRGRRADTGPEAA